MAALLAAIAGWIAGILAVGVLKDLCKEAVCQILM
jgi:hypothetical protein